MEAMEGREGIADVHPNTGAATRAEHLAVRLHPHRALLLAAGLGSFVVGVLPLAAVVHGFAPLARWHTALFAASLPAVLWAIGLVVLATFFHPTQGLVAARNVARIARPPWLQRLLRAYAAFTVGAFGVSPFVVFTAALAPL